MAGRLYVGTSGFAYPDWRPYFYPATARPSQLLSLYAARLPAVELNNTFYQQPGPQRVATWLEQTPADFRFVVKAQRGGSLRAFASAAAQTMEWLTGPYRGFGERLGTVLLRVPGNVPRDDARLAALLDAWPAEMPLTVELQHASWQDDEVLAALSARDVALCATDLDDGAQPDVRLTGRFLYLRLRRAFYSTSELETWAARLLPFMEDGRDAYVFLRHDPSGESALRAVRLRELVEGQRTQRGD